MPFVVAAPDADETPLAAERPADTALRLAQAKARSVVHRFPHALIIGSDQVADCEGVAIGKAPGREAAVALLERLAGRTVVFHTGLALLDAASGDCTSALVDVTSRFRALTHAEIGAYVDRDRPFDCAGAVRVETLGIALFHAVQSEDPTALIGLPLIRLTDMLHAAGVRPLG